MPDRTPPTVRLEPFHLGRVEDVYEAVIESSQEWFAEGMIDKPDFSMDELEAGAKNFQERWEKDEFYMFRILDASTDQLLGFVFLNHVNRTHQIANLGYFIRTSRVGQGIATQAAKLAARYGFETLGFQRLEIVVRPENAASMKVAENAGAVREALLRHRLRHHGSPWDAYMYSLIPADLGMDNAG